MATYTFTKEQLENEVWKPIPNYEDLYQVSNIGRVKSIKFDRFLKPSLKKHYLHVSLSKLSKSRHFSVHGLVALAFIGKRPTNKTTNHIDLNKLNNCAYNLEYVTQKQNIRHAKKFGRMRKGSEMHNAKLDEKSAALVHILSRFGVVQHEIAEFLSMSKSSVGDILRGKNWKHVKPRKQPELKQIAENISEFEFDGKTYQMRDR